MTSSALRSSRSRPRRSADGMARLRARLCDGAGPLYGAVRANELRLALEHIARWLPVAS